MRTTVPKTNENRRQFLKSAAAATTSLVLPAAKGRAQATLSQPLAHASAIDIVRPPDRIRAHFISGDTTPLQYAAREWTCPGVKLSTEVIQSGKDHELPVTVIAPGGTLLMLHLRWEGRLSKSLRILGDQWERSYGDLEWRGVVPERIMPWYFFSFDGTVVHGYGVKTQPSAFCFWQQDNDGISLWIDLKNGGDAAVLGDRELKACTIVSRNEPAQESMFAAMHAFCATMCTAPRFPKEPLFGSNDWNYAYGKNTEAGILRDADLIAALAPGGAHRPTIVIDDGWQDQSRFPSMVGLAASIRAKKLHPGLWIRPLRAPKTTPENWLLPQVRFGRNSHRNDLAFDPTNSEALEEILKQVRVPAQWGYGFLKHDFTTYELFGRWGSEMGSQPALPGWRFQDRTRANAEIISELYRAIRKAAGEDTVVLGCNTVGHLAAGIFDSQRIADDTSGREWERTRRFGVNGLAHRIAQHRTFSYVDPDCVAITNKIGWRQTSQWLDVVARSGTSLFVSPDPSAITPEARSAVRDAMAIAVANAAGYPVDIVESTTPSDWEFQRPSHTSRTYDWCTQDGASPILTT